MFFIEERNILWTTVPLFPFANGVGDADLAFTNRFSLLDSLFVVVDSFGSKKGFVAVYKNNIELSTFDKVK